VCTAPYVDVSGAVARSEIVQHGRLVQVRHVGHVLDLLELWRIHLLDLVLLHRLLLWNATHTPGRFV